MFNCCSFISDMLPSYKPFATRNKIYLCVKIPCSRVGTNFVNMLVTVKKTLYIMLILPNYFSFSPGICKDTCVFFVSVNSLLEFDRR